MDENVATCLINIATFCKKLCQKKKFIKNFTLTKKSILKYYKNKSKPGQKLKILPKYF
jgi:hypothetical protein